MGKRILSSNVGDSAQRSHQNGGYWGEGVSGAVHYSVTYLKVKEKKNHILYICESGCIICYIIPSVWINAIKINIIKLRENVKVKQ